MKFNLKLNEILLVEPGVPFVRNEIRKWYAIIEQVAGIKLLKRPRSLYIFEIESNLFENRLNRFVVISRDRKHL